MSFYCFNPECEHWGDVVRQEAVGRTLEWPGWGSGIGHTKCPSCGQDSYWHDNWDKDERMSDDGTKPTR